MTDLTRKSFLELIRRDGIEYNIETRYPVVRCRHDSGLPVHYAAIKYPDEGVGEIYLWHPGREEWLLQNFGWINPTEEDLDEAS